MPDNASTTLAPQEEAQYRAWMSKIGHTAEAGYNVSSDFSGTDYDYRGFFKKNGPVDVSAGAHLTDEFKLPNHPTFSVESRYAVGVARAKAGSWDGEKYVPAKDRITFDDAFAESQTPKERITFDDAISARESQITPAGQYFGQAPGMGEQFVTRGDKNYIAPEPKAAEHINFGASLKQNLVDDPETRRRLIAESLFPNDPKGIERVGFADGVAVYVDDTGALRRVSPKTASAGAIVTANLPEAVGAAIGAASGMPVLGAALGGAGGKAYKKIVSNLVFDEPQTAGGNAADLAIEGGLNVVGGLVGKGAAKFSDRGRMIDFTPANRQAAEKVVTDVKNKFGIDLDLAQASGDRKLIALRNYAARYPGKSAELIQAVDEAAQGQFEGATKRVLDLVAKAEPSEVAGARGVNAAKLTIDTAKQKVYKDVEPLYEAAYAAVPEITDQKIIGMLELPYFDAAFTSGQKIAKLEGNELAKGAKPDLRSMDYTKRALDDRIETLKEAGKKQEARALKIRRDEFVQSIDALPNQQWQLARKRYGELINAEVKPLEDGAVGVLANIGDAKLATAAAKILSDPNVTAQQIRSTRSAISVQDPDAFNGLVRQWLGQKFDKAMRETQTGDVVNPAGKFRQAVYGSPGDREKAEAMLPGNAAKIFDELMGAAEKLASTPIRGSDTEPNRMITEQLKGKALAVISWFISPRQAARNAAEQNAIQNGVDSLTEALLNPQKRNQLRQIARMAPSTRQAIMLSTVLGGQTLERTLSEPDDFAPEKAIQ